MSSVGNINIAESRSDLFLNVGKWLFVLLILAIFSVSEIMAHYDSTNTPMSIFLILCTIGTFCKFLPLAFLLVIMPGLFRAKQYTFLGAITAIMVLTFIIIQNIAEYLVARHYGISSIYTDNKINFVFDFLTNNAQWFLVAMTIMIYPMLHIWKAETIRREEMETQRLRMESELLKEQISPSLLFETLHRSGEQAHSNPDNASQRLMILSRILRYQLYDCNREKVLLDGEVRYLKDYLSLLKLNGRCADFSFLKEGNSMGYLIAPLLLVELIQPKSGHIDILLQLTDRFLKIRIDGDCRDVDKVKIRVRLDKIYPERYELKVSENRAIMVIYNSSEKGKFV